MGARQAAGEHHGVKLSRVHVLRGQVGFHRDAVGAGDFPSCHPGQCYGDPSPAQDVHRGKGLDLFKTIG